MNNNNEIINLCRACLCSSEQKFSFFTHAEDLQDESKNISDIYSDCTSLKVNETYAYLILLHTSISTSLIVILILK